MHRSFLNELISVMRIAQASIEWLMPGIKQQNRVKYSGQREKCKITKLN